MGFYDGMSNIPAAGDGAINPGRYPAVLVKNVKGFAGHHGQRHIFTLVPLLPGAKNPPNDPTLPDLEPSPVGAVRSCGSRVDGPYAKIGLGEVKAATGVLMGFDVGQVDARGAEIEAMAARSIEPEQPLAGKIIAADLWYAKTKNGKILKYRFRECDAVTLAQVQGAAAAAMSAPDLEDAPGTPPPPPPPASAAIFPPAGWFVDPHGRGYYNAAGQIKSEAELRAL